MRILTSIFLVSFALATPTHARPNNAALYDPIVESHREHLDPALIRAVIRAESNWSPRAVSRAGAMGLMQLMPGTARLVGVRNAFDPAENIRGGVAYLRAQLDRFGRLDYALAAYNAGPDAVEKYGGIPPYRETRDYVRRILRWYGRGTDTASITGGARYIGDDYRRQPSPVLLTSASPARSVEIDSFFDAMRDEIWKEKEW